MTVLHKILFAFAGLLTLSMFTGALGTVAVFYLDFQAGQIVLSNASSAEKGSRAAMLAIQVRRYEKEFVLALSDASLRSETQKRWFAALEELQKLLQNMEIQATGDQPARIKQAQSNLKEYRAAVAVLVDAADAGTVRTPADASLVLGNRADTLNTLINWTEALSKEGFQQIGGIPTLIAGVTRTVAIVCGTLVGAGTVVVVLMSFGIFRTLSRPLERTIELSNRVANGDLTVEFPTDKKDEFGRIWKAFGTTVSRLREVLGQVSTVSTRVSEVASEVSQVTTKFSSNAQTQASSSEEISAAVEELVASIQTVANDAKDQVALVGNLSARLGDLSVKIADTDTRFQQGRALNSDLVQEAQQAQSAMQSLSASMEGITANSRRVSEIVEIINDISDRINLLSLNASIEAARAGDAGRGFAVVATEISRLADQTAASIKNISELTTQNEREVQGGADSTAATAAGLERIQQGVKALATVIEDLSTAVAGQVRANKSVRESLGTLEVAADAIRQASSEQSHTTDEIARSITEITEMSQNTAEKAEGLATTAGELRRLATAASDRLGFFQFGQS